MAISSTTSIPQVRVKPSHGGWLVNCSCKHESWHQRRPTADRAASDHLRVHATRTARTNRERSAR